MQQYPHLYIDGQWVDPADPRDAELIDPTREETFAKVTLGSAADADRAVSCRSTCVRELLHHARWTNGSH